MTDNVVPLPAWRRTASEQSTDTAVRAENILLRDELARTRLKLEVSQGLAKAAINNAAELALQLGAVEAERDMALHRLGDAL